MQQPDHTSPAEEERPLPARRRNGTKRFLLGCGLPCLFPLIFLLIPLTFVAEGIYQHWERKQQLLHQTDHAALLAASRELIRAHAGEQIPDPAHDPRVPPIIQALEPTYLMIKPDYLYAQLGGAHLPLTFTAQLAETPATNSPNELIPGLYYSEE